MSSIHQNPIPTPPPRRRGHARPVPVYTAPSDLSHRLWHCAIGAMIAFGIGCEISIRGLGIKPAAPAITIPAAILGALIVWFFPRRRRWQTLAITPTELQLQSFDHQAITIPPTGVSLLLGENGISTAGGDMLIWKRLHIATPGRRYTFRFDPHFNASAYHALLHACPHAIGVSTSGAVAVPRAALHSDEAIAACTRVVRTEFTRRARRTFLAALVAIAIVAGGVALITLAAARDPNFTADSIAPTSVYLVVALAFSISLTASALATRARGRRILRTIAARAEHPAAHSDLPSHVLFDLPPPPPPAPRRPRHQALRPPHPHPQHCPDPGPPPRPRLPPPHPPNPRPGPPLHLVRPRHEPPRLRRNPLLHHRRRVVTPRDTPPRSATSRTRRCAALQIQKIFLRFS